MAVDSGEILRVEAVMSREEYYNGFVIEARSSELRGNLGWDSMFELRKDDEASIVITRFQLEGVFTTGEKALASALAHGRKKIDDGFIPSA
jgi:hypothetical protein